MDIKAQKIRIMLAEQNMTQGELASKTGISRQSISTILQRGTAIPKNVGKLATGLGVPVSEIIREEAQP